MTAQTTVAPESGTPRLTRMADIPAGLEPGERSAYLASYNRALKSYNKNHGTASISGPVPKAGTAARKMFALRLEELTREHVAASHPIAHKAGMSGLARYRKSRGIVVPVESVKPARAPRKPRKTATVETPEVTPSDVLAAGIESGRVHIIPVTAPAPVETVETVDVTPDPVDVKPYRTKRAARRELAAEMRAAGVKPEGQAWEAAKAKAGLS